MMRAKLINGRWVRSFLSSPRSIGAALKEGGACKKTTVDFSAEAKVRQFVFRNKKGGYL
jgi:hypothetical protein